MAAAVRATTIEGEGCKVAGVREDRRREILPGPGPGSRSAGVLALALIGVVAAIALLWNVSRRPAYRPPAPVANVEPVAEPPPAEPTPAPAVAPAETDRQAISARKQSEITRVIKDGRPGLKACYQRALVRDESLVYGDLTVRLSVAASGRVDRVSVIGPQAFRVLEPCLETAVSKWSFPAASEPYEAEFPLVLHGRE
jgi:hypothetical protein